MLDLSKSITVPILSGTEKRCKVQFPSETGELSVLWTVSEWSRSAPDLSAAKC